jgi:hypothetical protein
MKNTEARKTAKSAIGFALVIILLAATFFGLKVPYGVEDVLPQDTTETQAPVENEPTNEETQAPATEAPKTDDNVAQEPNTDKPEGENADKEAPVEDTKENVSTDSATDEAVKDNVDNSGETNVAEPTEDETTATEGDVENA